ncbi:MAG TPA: S8 family peptidase [Terriglobia bacterium]|nr:S8 family peptidase [Terriglobia bacterium]
MKRIIAISMTCVIAIGLCGVPAAQAQTNILGTLWGTASPVMSAANINAKLDQWLQDRLKTGNPGERVDVIVQTKLPAAVEAQLIAWSAKLNQKYKNFSFIAIKLPLGFIRMLAAQPFITKISHDGPVMVFSAVDGVEAANSSSGALDAFQRFGATGSGVGVAVIDSGIAPHPDLNNVVYNVDFTTSDPAVRTDPFGHGTHVAGILAGSGQSSNGMYAGVAPGVRLVNLRVLDANGGGYTRDVIAAIDWAIANKNMPGNDGQSMNIRVLNLSLGHLPQEGAETDPLSVACRRAVQAGFVVVASAGNSGRDASGTTVYGAITSPGIEPSVLTVGAMSTFGTPSRSDDRIGPYSSRGPTIDGIVKPDIVAPGSRIAAAMSAGNMLVTAHPTLKIDNNYMRMTGTSMAAPAVSGAVALLLSKAPNLTPNAVKGILMYTAEDRGSPLDYGVGYVNIPGALDVATSINPAAPVGQVWLNNPNLPYSDLINGFPAVWGQNIGWADKVYASNAVRYNDPTWALGVVWGKTNPSQIIALKTTVSAQSLVVSGLTIVWDELAALTIVWDEALTIVWDEF